MADRARSHAGDSVVLVERATAIAYRCRCGWISDSVDPRTPHALVALKQAMAVHLGAPTAPRGPAAA